MDKEFFMTQALLLAKEAADEGEVPVGAVVVKDGVFTTYTPENG